MNVLLLGGHGKIALRLIPLLLARSWSVTAVIRNPEHKPDILSLANNHPGKLSVLLSSLDEVRSDADAKRILDAANPDYVVWAAGTIPFLPYRMPTLIYIKRILTTKQAQGAKAAQPAPKPSTATRQNTSWPPPSPRPGCPRSSSSPGSAADAPSPHGCPTPIGRASRTSSTACCRPTRRRNSRLTST